MRVFYIDPFLKYDFGHYFEAALAIKDFFRNQKKLTQCLVGNVGISEKARKFIGAMVPFVRQTCFQDLENKGKSFAEDLVNLSKKFSFTEKDLLFIPAAYENQILGVAEFINHRKSQKKAVPKIALQFHQIYPPTKESDDVMKAEFRGGWEKRLEKAFSLIKNSQVSLWSTEAILLNQKLARLSQGKVGILPVPFIFPKKVSPQIPKHKITIGFIGDGRQEKGLSLFLRIIPALTERKANLNFVIQNLSPRGFSDHQENEFANLLKMAAGFKNVKIINGALSPGRYNKLLCEIDIVVLPYNPQNYCQRASGILMQASIYQKPMIVSRGTWMEKAIMGKRASGLIFEYADSSSKTSENLLASLEVMVDNLGRYRQLAKSNSGYYRENCNSSQLIKTLIRHYEKK